MCHFASILCRPSSRVMYASGLPLEYKALMPLSPVTALGGCSWSVHPASLLPLLSSQDGSMEVKETQLISTSGTCRKWPAVGLPLKLAVRRYACTHGVYNVWQYVYICHTWRECITSTYSIVVYRISAVKNRVFMVMMYMLVVFVCRAPTPLAATDCSVTED